MGKKRGAGGYGLTAEEKKLLAALRTPRLRAALLAVRQNSARAEPTLSRREGEPIGPR